MTARRNGSLRRWLWVGLVLTMVTVTVQLMAEEVIEDATGTMQKVGSFGYGIVPDGDDGSRYAPTEEVEESFRVDGLRVRFSGVVGDPSEGRGGRRWGTPIELTKLERLPPDADEAPPGDDGSDRDSR